MRYVRYANPDTYKVFKFGRYASSDTLSLWCERWVKKASKPLIPKFWVLHDSRGTLGTLEEIADPSSLYPPAEDYSVPLMMLTV